MPVIFLYDIAENSGEINAANGPNVCKIFIFTFYNVFFTA